MPQPVPTTQKAWIIQHRGTPTKAMSLRDDWPVPSVPAGNVLVKVKAAALNPAGYKMMKLVPNIFSGRPLIAEFDLAGTVLNGNDTGFSPGDPVFGIIPAGLARRSKQGALAQYVVSPAANLALCPPNVSLEEASGITLAAETAFQALVHLGDIQQGQTVLINGGSSSVGAFAIQIAKAMGATVFATASGPNEEFVRAQGADEFIDYTKAPLYEQLLKVTPPLKFHLIFDAVCLVDPSLYTHCPAYLTRDGIFISAGPNPTRFTLHEVWLGLKTGFHIIWPRIFGGVPRTYKMVLLNHNKTDLEALRNLVAQGKLKPIVDSVFEFDDVQDAYKRLMTGRARGKVIVRVDNSTAG